MTFKQYYLGCLAHASYLVADGGEAAVIDPQRDVDQYLEDARAVGAVIRYVIETHLHADFVSGHVELARKAGARVYIGHRAGATFEHVPVKDGDSIRLGGKRLTFLETPGHTPESITVVLSDAATGRPEKVLTGDTLFIGDVGRPDLVGSKGFSAEQMASMLYDSLQQKILTLPDETEVFPAHGAGSACGRAIIDEPSSTIGKEKIRNYALQPMARAEFVKLVTEGLPPPPAYFPYDAELNRRGAAPLADRPPVPRLSVDAALDLVQEGAILLDVREDAAFSRAHVPRSLHIGLSGSFASWAGSLIPVDRDVVLVTDREAEVAEAVVRLARVGLERVAGALEGGFAAWAASQRKVASVPFIQVNELARRLGAPGVRILDVRGRSEHDAGHIPGAMNIPLAELAARAPVIPPGDTIYVTCASGYRSLVAASILRRLGIENAVNVAGGHKAWAAAGHPLEAPPRPPEAGPRP